MEHTDTPFATLAPARRSRADRRVRQTCPLSLASFRGARKTIRRQEDRGVHYYIDLYGPAEGLLFIFILFLSIADAFLTLELIRGGLSEFNAVMDYFLQLGPLPFVLVKYLLTATGLVCLLIHKNYPIFRGRLGVKAILVGVAAMYCALIAYELLLVSLSPYFSTFAVSMTTALTGTS
jgi:hypothetical protein